MSSSTASATKRHSILPPLRDSGPKAPVRFSSSLVIADSAILTGTHTITLRTESLVHPRAKIESQIGPIDVGKRCIVQERTHVGAAGSVGVAADEAQGVTIYDYCTVQAGAVVEAGGTVVGEGTLVGVGARVGRGARIGNWCTISPRTIVPPGTQIDDFTVVFSNGQQRRDRRDVKDIRKRQQIRQLEVLQKLIPSNPAKFG
ncbi:trimeric LpxA-like protein [Cryphonectria parasitica EP155]|uniref:Dynactin subunit 6 n=1 Tax=Cryphonectria parasitica (strain ATCC 38755 / EP155) TaxID=660469 RepID=A0A9P4XVJ6_CRYP1|nr:trimeric LpxA-like protein [Cryphonectria parasitica EP155]KAF3761606.1 trimeric LpxA-like protein [Cryphonectria parasitica EP155]